MFNFHKLLRQSAIVFAVSGSLNATAFAENMKFGYVHAERLYSQSKTAQGIELTLKKNLPSSKSSCLICKPKWCSCNKLCLRAN